ncbi:MAG: radical SAM protein [Pseudobutyrivibrio sp.]|nr:radical SAM protein [Pseudobutyrivibrio sp.]
MDNFTLMNPCYLHFKTANNNNYIYDGITNSVFATDEIIDDCIILFQSHSFDDVKKILTEKYTDIGRINSACAFVDKMIQSKHAFYKDESKIKNDEKHLFHFNKHDIQKCLYDLCLMEQMILNVSEDCNLSCKYCFFSGEYINSRNRSHRKMTEEIAFKSIDYFFEQMLKIKRKHPGKIPAITFYGGEPLMNFELIKSCTNHIKRIYPYKYELSITTNGTLLDEEKSEFLYENNFTIAVRGTYNINFARIL